MILLSLEAAETRLSWAFGLVSRVSCLVWRVADWPGSFCQRKSETHSHTHTTLEHSNTRRAQVSTSIQTNRRELSLSLSLSLFSLMGVGGFWLQEGREGRRPIIIISMKSSSSHRPIIVVSWWCGGLMSAAIFSRRSAGLSWETERSKVSTQESFLFFDVSGEHISSVLCFLEIPGLRDSQDGIVFGSWWMCCYEFMLVCDFFRSHCSQKVTRSTNLTKHSLKSTTTSYITTGWYQATGTTSN